jgi:hypothetical protein
MVPNTNLPPYAMKVKKDMKERKKESNEMKLPRVGER